MFGLMRGREVQPTQTGGFLEKINVFPGIRRESFLLSAALFLLLVAAGSAAYFYIRLAQLQQNPQAVAASEVEDLVAEVGQLIILPQGEVPTVATVTDPERLKNQPFFAQAKIGYKVLLYSNARKAILYDPGEKKIVEVAPINIGNQ